MKKLITIISIGILFLTSCKKDEIPQPNQPSNPTSQLPSSVTFKAEFNQPIDTNNFWSFNIHYSSSNDSIDHLVSYTIGNYVVYGTDTLYDGQSLTDSNGNIITWYNIGHLVFYNNYVNITINQSNLIYGMISTQHNTSIDYPIYSIDWNTGNDCSLQLDSIYVSNYGYNFTCQP